MKKILVIMAMLLPLVCVQAQTPSGQVYVGVVAFNSTVSTFPISNDLDAAKSFILSKNNDVDRTALCYAVSKSVTLFDADGLPAFDKIFVVSFTDGIDNGSSSLYSADGRVFPSALVYDTAQVDLQKKVGLDAYTIGFGDQPLAASMQKLVVGKGSYKTANSNTLNSTFQEIANSVLASSKNVLLRTQDGVFTEDYPKYIRFTIIAGGYSDVIDAKIVGYTLSIITAGNYASFDAPITGTQSSADNKIEIPLNNLKFVKGGDEIAIAKIKVEMSSDGITYYEDVEDASTSESISKRIAIALVLDCSTSLGTANFAAMQSAANNFIDILHANTDHFPEATTSEVANIGRTSATFYGNITAVGNPTYTERGFCYSTSQNPTISDTKVIASYSGNTGSYSYVVSGLTAGTTYYVRTYATGSLGTAYGNQVSFTTVDPLRTVTFDSQGGSAINSQTIDSGTAINRPIDPTRAGYSLDGWYTDAACTTAWNFANLVTQDTTLYAKWIKGVFVTNNNSSGAGSLSQIISNAADGDTIRFANSMAGKTITLASAITISKNLTIEGNGVIISGNDSYRILYINSGYTVNVSRVHFKNGYYYSNSSSGSFGGAIYNNSGVLNLQSCIFSNNKTANSQSSSYTNGGAIYNTNGTLAVTGCTFYNNSAYYGAAIYNSGGISYLSGNLFNSNADGNNNSYHVVYNGSGTVTSGGYNVSDKASGSSSGFTFATGDKQVTTVPINPVTFVPTSSGATDLNIIPAALSDFPKTDFYGTPRNTYPTAAGAAIATITSHTVTFAVASEEVSVGAKVSQPAAPSRNGDYTFDGWYKDAECTTAWDFATDVVTNDITLYAKWTSGNTVIRSAATEPFAIYPNPAKEMVTIKNVSGKTVGIVNSLGNTVFEKEVQSDEATIPVSSWASGIYIVRISDKGKLIGTMKLIKD
ncbi:MAG: InlB B-repeat-containing protein [Candidatus Symbiothrix sp.]|jgi:uncharacterized repeat protein (TIGR02543 family)|nr:InlB B-repeat-containing protein [Candidatus Symbiothrix sp.]